MKTLIKENWLAFVILFGLRMSYWGLNEFIRYTTRPEYNFDLFGFLGTEFGYAIQVIVVIALFRLIQSVLKK